MSRFDITRRSLFAMGSLLTAASISTLSNFAHAQAGGEDGGEDGGDVIGGSGGVCFAKGTSIRTVAGESPVEALRRGDLLPTIDGDALPVQWIGKRVHARPPARIWPADLLPIRIGRSALADNVPHRDLYVSAAHCFFLEGMLIEARELINGRTIQRCAVEADTIEYFHIKLECHSIIYAEGAPAESLLGVHEDYWDDVTSAEVLTIDEACAPIFSLPGNRARLASRLRSAVSPIVDYRNDLEIRRDKVEAQLLGRLD